MGVDFDDLTGRLARWASAHYEPSAIVDDVRAMPGHAGLSFGFRVLTGAGVELDHLVVRMPPKGVRRAGNTDVLRQVPLLQAMRAADVPVAEVVWWSDDEQWFEVPFFMVRMLPGETYLVREPSASFAGVSCAEVLRRAVEALAQVHALDHARVLTGWELPREVRTEIEFWTPLIAKAAEPEWRRCPMRRMSGCSTATSRPTTCCSIRRRLPSSQYSTGRSAVSVRSCWIWAGCSS
jgi:aminoglycoside phosphotransferase (APT) family kinase protein